MALDESRQLTRARERVRSVVHATPGIHTRAVARACGVSVSTAHAHLGSLVRDGEVTMSKDGRYRRFFPPGFDHHHVSVASAMRRRVPAALLGLLATEGRLRPSELASRANVARSTTAAALAWLRREGLVLRHVGDGGVTYAPANEALVSATLRGPSLRQDPPQGEGLQA